MGRLAEFKPVAQTETKSKFEGLIDRNHNGAPIIWPEGTDPEAVAKWRASGATIKDRDARLRPKGGKAYSRTTKFIDVVDDKEGLIKWLNRKTLLGASLAPGLGQKVLDVEDPDSREGKALLDRYVKDAQDAAHADLKALAGTSIHEVFEDYDEGRDTGFLLDEVQVLLDAYKVATKDLEVAGVELFGVEDTYEVAGTLDRLFYDPTTWRLVVADVKGFPLDTKIATPSGWTTMGDVRVGDEVLGSDGKPCTVSIKSPTKNIGCYRVSFDDGTSIVCDEEHLWETTIVRTEDTAVRSVLEIKETLYGKHHRPQLQHRIDVAPPLDLPEADLPLDPYFLGVWLGDGRARNAEWTKGADDGQIADEVASRGIDVRLRKADPARPTVLTWGTRGVTGILAKMGLLNNKHVPPAYLRASVTQRLDLLRGLMDTDGGYNKPRKSVQFSSTDSALRDAVAELATSLGERVYTSQGEARGFGLVVTAYHVRWTPARFNPFLLRRKADQVTVRDSGRNLRRLITAVEEVESVPTACIGVSASDHIYLVGERMIKTHNTGSIAGAGKIARQLAFYAHMKRYNPETFERTPYTFNGQEVDREVALIIHAPSDGDYCNVYEVNIAEAWQDIETCRAIYDIRNKWNRKAYEPRLVSSSRDV